jgi:putative phosphoesterase
MKIMVVSDTHGNYLAPVTILEETGADMLIHLGDEINDALTLDLIVDVPVIKVPGNCDHGAKEPRELLESFSGKLFFITHGDIYRVKNGLDQLVEKTKKVKASVALFGHTHKPLIQNQDGVLLINPGTLMAGSDSKSYAILTVTPSKVTAEIIYLN